MHVNYTWQNPMNFLSQPISVCVCLRRQSIVLFYFMLEECYFYKEFPPCLSLPGLRPFGVSILYMGWDKHYGFQLYQSDPSGNYSGWKATCIGNNSVVSL